MRALALDPVTHDLALPNGRAFLVTGVDAKAQRLKCRLGLWKGENRMNLDDGIPYQDLLGDVSQIDRTERILRAAAATSPGIATLTRFEFSRGANRVATVENLEALTTDGEPLSLAAFNAASAP